MEKYELPLVIFTLLSQMSVGITLLLTWRMLRGEMVSNRLYWLINGVIFAVASVAAVLHLAHPMFAYNALINLENSWLSREILTASVYGTAIGLTFLTGSHKVPAMLASLVGIILVIVQGETYAATAMAAIANGLTMMLFFLTVWVMGCAALPLLNTSPSTALLKQGILVFISLLIAAPLIWTSGSAMMQMTAQSWLASPLYLGSLMCLATSLILIRKDKYNTKVVFVVLLVGVFLSRMTFFGDTISTITNIGHLY